MGIEGWKKHTNRLRKLSGSRMERDVGKAVFAGAEGIQVEAQLSITNGAVSGAGHVPSKPGEAPNQDTGHLAGNIEVTQPKPLVARVSSNADYAATLEYESSKIAERPYMRPARDAKEGDARKLIVKAINRNINRRS